VQNQTTNQVAGDGASGKILSSARSQYLSPQINAVDDSEPGDKPLIDEPFTDNDAEDDRPFPFPETSPVNPET
jgi:hypothetical protein